MGDGYILTASVSSGTASVPDETDAVSLIWGPRLGWIDGVKVALGTVFFRTTLPCSGGYYMERGGMPLHDAVGINCKNGATTENQDSAVKYMG